MTQQNEHLNRTLEEIKQDVKDVKLQTASIPVMNNEIGHLKEDVSTLKRKMENVEARPGTVALSWIDKVVGILVVLVLGYLFSGRFH